jgi:hypothetical protein
LLLLYEQFCRLPFRHLTQNYVHVRNNIQCTSLVVVWLGQLANGVGKRIVNLVSSQIEPLPAMRLEAKSTARNRAVGLREHLENVSKHPQVGCGVELIEGDQVKGFGEAMPQNYSS